MTTPTSAFLREVEFGNISKSYSILVISSTLMTQRTSPRRFITRTFLQLAGSRAHEEPENYRPPVSKLLQTPSLRKTARGFGRSGDLRSRCVPALTSGHSSLSLSIAARPAGPTEREQDFTDSPS